MRLAIIVMAFTAVSANAQHPVLLFQAKDVAELRQRFQRPEYADLRRSVLQRADELLAYEGESPQPGRKMTDRDRAYKLAAQKKEAVLNTLPWAYLLTGQTRYRDMYLEVMRWEGKRRYNVDQYRWEFELSRLGAPAALAYDWLWPEMKAEDRQLLGEYLDQFLKPKAKPTYGWSNNIGAIYWSGVGIVALARYHENPAAPAMVKECIRRLDEFYNVSLRPHDDGGYPEGPLYRNYALLWLLTFVEAYERVTGDKKHGLLDPPFFRNGPRYLETLLGGNGVWVTFNDCQPQYYGAPWAAYLGARFDQPLLRWWADYALAEGMKTGTNRVAKEIGPPYNTMAFLWRDAKKAEFPGLPTLSTLPSLNIGALRSDRAVKPGLMLAVRGRGVREAGHNQPDTGSFVLYARGENFLIDPGYYQPEAEKHSLLLINGAGPTGRKAAPLTGAEAGTLRWLAVDAGADYPAGAKVRRVFAMLGADAVIVLDEVAAGQVTMLLQTGMKPQLAADKQSVLLPGKQTRLWLQSFGPATAWSVSGPHDFGRSWIYRRLAEAGEVSWHTLRAEYTADAGHPVVTVFVPLPATASAPVVKVERAAGQITVRLPAGAAVRFVRENTGWAVARP